VVVQGIDARPYSSLSFRHPRDVWSFIRRRWRQS